MKVQILNLDAGDELASVLDKLKWVQAQRVILVWPPNGRILTRQLDLVLLQRLANRRGFQLGLVSFDPDVLQNSRSLGIPQFQSIDDIEESRWKIPRGSKARQRVQKRAPRAREELRLTQRSQIAATKAVSRLGRFAIFTLGIFAVLLLSAAIVPSATIRVKPNRFNQTTWITINIRPGQSGLTGAGGLPVQTVTVPVFSEARTMTSGYRNTPDQYATGTVVFTNLQDEAFTIPAGTGVRSTEIGEIRFETLKGGDLDPEVGATIELPVRAYLPGEAGNLEEGSVDSIEGELGLSLRVTNPEAFEGGSSSVKPAVHQRDLDRLHEQLQAELIELAKDEISNTLLEDQRLLHGSLQIQEDLQVDYDQSVGDLAESVGLELKSAITGWVYNTSELEKALESTAINRLPEGSVVLPNTFRILEIQELISSAGDSGKLQIRLQQQWTNGLPEGEMVQRLRGVAVENAVRILQEEFGTTGHIAIEVRPNWFPRLPLLTSRYAVIFEGL